MKRALFLLPLGLFLVVAGYFFWQLSYGRDPSIIPSALIDDPVPATELPALKDDKPGFGRADFGHADAAAEPVLVNVFASWCVPCRAEHPYITAIAETEGIAVYGINTKDRRQAALDWLRDLGDPYAKIGFDPEGKAVLDWGVYGYPETFLVNRRGKIVYKHVGPIHPELIDRELRPLIRAVLEES